MTLGTAGLITMAGVGVSIISVAALEKTNTPGLITMLIIAGGGLWYLFNTLQQVLSNTFFL